MCLVTPGHSKLIRLFYSKAKLYKILKCFLSNEQKWVLTSLRQWPCTVRLCFPHASSFAAIRSILPHLVVSTDVFTIYISRMSFLLQGPLMLLYSIPFAVTASMCLYLSSRLATVGHTQSPMELQYLIQWCSDFNMLS